MFKSGTVRQEIRRSVGPAPNAYNPKPIGAHEQSAGLGSAVFTSMSGRSQQRDVSMVPGPGHYESDQPSDPLGGSGRPQVQQGDVLGQQVFAAGWQRTELRGNDSSSMFSNLGLDRFGNPHLKRTPANLVPGPGSYAPRAVGETVQQLKAPASSRCAPVQIK